MEKEWKVRVEKMVHMGVHNREYDIGGKRTKKQKELKSVYYESKYRARKNVSYTWNFLCYVAVQLQTSVFFFWISSARTRQSHA